MTNKSLTVALIAVAIIAVIGVFTPLKTTIQNAFGGVTSYDEVDATALKIGGANGSRVGPIIALNGLTSSTCAMTGTGGTFAASTTLAFSCPVTGVVAGDVVFASAASTTNTGSGGWIIKGAVASSTAGSIEVYMVNFTGGTAAVPLAIASSTNLIILHPVTSVPGF